MSEAQSPPCVICGHQKEDHIENWDPGTGYGEDIPPFWFEYCVTCEDKGYQEGLYTPYHNYVEKKD